MTFLKRAMGQAGSTYSRTDRQGNRALLASWFLHGEGIEVGALHSPLPVPEGVVVRYVDRFPAAKLREHYPELHNLPLVDPDIVDDGQILSTVADATQDFVIANHFIEHCEDPIRTVGNFLRVLRPGGVLYLAIPDKTQTFDKDRPITPFEHLMVDYEQGPAASRREHFMDWSHYVDKATLGEAQIMRANHLVERDYSIHFHVWDKPAMLDMIYNLGNRAGLALTPTMFMDNGEEGVWILTK